MSKSKVYQKSSLCSGLGLGSPEGFSNTPLMNYQKADSNVCIDYFKIRFNKEICFGTIEANLLLKALKVEFFPNEMKENIGNFKEFYVFQTNVSIGIGDSSMINKYGERTTILEMKGQACRDFESRGGSWLELIKVCLDDLRGEGKRIDLAYDDYRGFFSYKKLFEKLDKHFYKAIWKSGFVYRKSGEDGISYTWGKESKREFQIYNKLAERKARNITCYRNFWYRFELRFKDEKATECMIQVLYSLQKNDFDILVKSYLKDWLNILDSSGNYTWKSWLDFLGTTKKIETIKQARVPNNATNKFVWFRDSCSRSMCILLSYFIDKPALFDSLIKYVCFDAIKKIKSTDFYDICNYRKAHNLKDITYQELVDRLQDFTMINDIEINEVLKRLEIDKK